MHTPPRQEFFIFLKRLRLVEIFLVYRYRNREFGNREWVWNGDRGERWKTLILWCSVISFVKWVLEVFSSRELQWRFWGFFMCVCVCVSILFSISLLNLPLCYTCVGVYLCKILCGDPHLLHPLSSLCCELSKQCLDQNDFLTCLGG